MIGGRIKRLRFAQQAGKRWVQAGALIGFVVGTALAVLKAVQEGNHLGGSRFSVNDALGFFFLSPLVFGVIAYWLGAVVRPVLVALFCRGDRFEEKYEPPRGWAEGVEGHAPRGPAGADETSAQRFEEKLRRIEEVLAAAEGVVPSAPTSPPAQTPAGRPGQDGGQLRGRILVRRELPRLRQSRLQRMAILGIVGVVGLGGTAVLFPIWGPWQFFVLGLVFVVPWLLFIGWLLSKVLGEAQPPPPRRAVPACTKSAPVPPHSAGPPAGAIRSPPNSITGM